MIDFAYCARQLRAIWQMAFGTNSQTPQTWQDELENDEAGFRRSLQALILGLPFALLAGATLGAIIKISPEVAPYLEGLSRIEILLVQAIGMWLEWGLALLTLALIVKAHKMDERLYGVLASYNWVVLLSIIAFVVPTLVLALTADPYVTTVLFFPAGALVLALQWRFIRVMFAANVGMTIFLLIVLGIQRLLTSTITIELTGVLR